MKQVPILSSESVIVSGDWNVLKNIGEQYNIEQLVRVTI